MWAGAKRAKNAASRIADALKIPFAAVDMRERFTELVLKPFLAAYLEGRTPNPCVSCNERVKFGALLEAADSLGASLLATGHFAKIKRDDTGAPRLFRGKDPAKDQSYFLHRVAGEVLGRLLLPLGGLTKRDALARVEAAGLADIVLPASQDLCFLAGSSLGEFLRHGLGTERFREGDIVDPEGNLLGTHRGLFDYTVGQRRGIGIPAEEPYYVLKLDVEANRLVVGRKEDLLTSKFLVDDVLWREESEPEETRPVEVKVRYRARPVPASLRRVEESVEVVTEKPVDAVAPGQAAVFYHGDAVAGGGVIRCALP
jgi:tRNA-specific 2-thiouridylase